MMIMNFARIQKTNRIQKLTFMKIENPLDTTILNGTTLWLTEVAASLLYVWSFEWYKRQLTTDDSVADGYPFIYPIVGGGWTAAAAKKDAHYACGSAVRCMLADGMVMDAYTDAHVPCHYIRFKCFLRGWLPMILLLLLLLLMCSVNVCNI